MSAFVDQAVDHLRSAVAEMRSEAARLETVIDELTNRTTPPPASNTIVAPPIELDAVPPRPTSTPKVARKKRPPVPPPGSVNFAEVASIANTAVAAGGSATDAVATHFGISDTAARQRIVKARGKGYDIAHARTGRTPTPISVGPVDVRSGIIPDGHASIGTPRRPEPQIPGRHFECNDCDDTDFPTTRELVHHAITSHQRQPHPEERTPIANRAAS